MVPMNTARHVFSAPVGSRFELISSVISCALFQLGRPALGVNVPRAILVNAVEVFLIRFRYGTARFVSLLVNPKKTLAIRFHRSRRTKTIEIESRNIVVLPWRFRRIAQTKDSAEPPD